jgi:hypothetical protein
MARGQQKIQAQEKNAKKLADKKKQAAGSTQKDAATKALHYKCPVCLVCVAMFDMFSACIFALSVRFSFCGIYTCTDTPV